MIFRLFLFSILFLALSAKSFAQEKDPKSFNFKWDNGFKLESNDKKFKLKFGGRIQLDHAYFNQNDELDASYGTLERATGTEIRRLRFFISGTIYQSVEFKLNVDFAGGEARLKDAYIGVKNIPGVGRIRVGHMKEPLRFDALTSSKYITFMERAIPADFANERNNGILLMNDFLDQKLSVQTGVFRNADSFGNDKGADHDIAWTSRITTLAINNLEKERLLHFGATYSYRKPDRDEYDISVRPKSHLSRKYISTGNIPDVETTQILNFEAAYSNGPFTVQAEYLTSTVKQKASSTSETYNFKNYYIQASYFITKEHRPFINSYSTFGRLKPKNNVFNGEKGIGAWEVALRYTNTDLNSENIMGGEQGDITLGLNWYLNPATRIMLNQVWTHFPGAGNLNIFEMRFQIDF
jgi:phosphate-selective porin OprO/OprP